MRPLCRKRWGGVEEKDDEKKDGEQKEAE